MERHELRRFLDELRASGAVTAAAAVVGDSRRIRLERGCGSKRPGAAGRVTTASLFDLASLTKPVMATLALVLDAERILPLRRSVGRAVTGAGSSAAASPGLARKRLESLLRHRAGLRPWAPLFARCSSAAEAVPWMISTSELLGAAPSTYSDLGYVLWGWLAERAGGESLASLVRARLAPPLGLDRLGPPPGKVAAAVSCRLGNGRERELAAAQGIEIPARRAPATGTVQDGNARFLGPSAHAGFFGSARDLWRLAAEWAEPRRLLQPDRVAAALGGRGDYVLGWRRRPPEARGRPGLWYGHVGFTGGGVWFSPDRREVRVLLAHRRSISVSMREWRERFLEIAA